MCIWSLGEMQPVELKDDLKKLQKTASDEDVDFGGNIMDRRVCTNLPSVNDALAELLANI